MGLGAEPVLSSRASGCSGLDAFRAWLRCAAATRAGSSAQLKASQCILRTIAAAVQPFLCSFGTADTASDTSQSLAQAQTELLKPRQQPNFTCPGTMRSCPVGAPASKWAHLPVAVPVCRGAVQVSRVVACSAWPAALVAVSLVSGAGSTQCMLEKCQAVGCTWARIAEL